MIRTALLLMSGVALDPDYTALTLPPNIAPLNADILGIPPGASTETTLSGPRGKAITLKGSELRYPLRAWRDLLAQNAGSDLTLTIRTNGVEALATAYAVSSHPIDPTLVYRLIGPSYESYSRMGIYQRDLASFVETPIYRNEQFTTRQCVNCHAFQDKNPETFQFHLRGESPGTVVFNGKEDIRKRSLKTGPLYASGVYPAWHPTRPFIAYSVNDTAQVFYTANPDKVEVLDSRSGIVLYHLETDTLTPVSLDPLRFETFPAWSPCGTTLYTVCAQPPVTRIPEDKTERFAQSISVYTNLCYDLVARAFDPETATFSPPVTLIDGPSKSITHPRPSPDGRWIVMTIGPYGCFQIWHSASDLFLYDTREKTIRPLAELNSPHAESYETWSSNGRWLIFNSRRPDATRTRPHITAFDPETGTFTKPFILPRKRPADHLERLQSYNVPELVKGPVPYGPRTLKNQAKAPAPTALWKDTP